MADEEKTTQDEIEQLQQEAAQAAQSAESDSSGSADLNQAEIDSLMSTGAGDEAAATATETKQATATDSGVTPHPVEQAGDDIQLLINQANAAAGSTVTPTPSSPDATPYRFSAFGGTAPNEEKATLELFRDVDLDLKIELGRTHMNLEDVLKLRQGSVVTLEKLAGDPVDVYANGRLIARGEVLVLNDNFCVRIAELISTEEAP